MPSKGTCKKGAPAPAAIDKPAVKNQKIAAAAKPAVTENRRTSARLAAISEPVAAINVKKKATITKQRKRTFPESLPVEEALDIVQVHLTVCIEYLDELKAQLIAHQNDFIEKIKPMLDPNTTPRNGQYTVSKVLEHRLTNDRKNDYYILWADYPLEECTWIERDFFGDEIIACKLITAFEKRRAKDVTAAAAAAEMVDVAAKDTDDGAADDVDGDAADDFGGDGDDADDADDADDGTDDVGVEKVAGVKEVLGSKEDVDAGEDVDTNDVVSANTETQKAAGSKTPAHKSLGLWNYKRAL